MAETTIVRAEQCIDVPAEVDDITAAAIANPGMSAWAALTERAHLKTGTDRIDQWSDGNRRTTGCADREIYGSVKSHRDWTR